VNFSVAVITGSVVHEAQEEFITYREIYAVFKKFRIKQNAYRFMKQREITSSKNTDKNFNL
jgi:hypothetical protein